MKNKIVNGCTIHLDSDGYFVGRYNTGSKQIHYNLKMINKMSKGRRIKFEECLMLVISHEFIHKLLDITEDEDTCVAWDNISELDMYGCI